MLKLQVDTLSKILTPETLQSLGLKRIKEIKELGKQNNYHLLVTQEIHVHPENNLVIQHKEHATQRAEELSYCCRFQGLSEQEKNLLKTQIRFIDDEKIITLLREHQISKEEIEELNAIVAEFQKHLYTYQQKLEELERQCKISYGQAFDIITKYYPMLSNNNYSFNKEDKKLYSSALFFALRIKQPSFLLKDSLNKINHNPLFSKLAKICENYFGMEQKHLYIFINKINEIFVTNPNLFNKLANSQKRK